MKSRHRPLLAAVTLAFAAACASDQPSSPSAPPAGVPDLRATAIPLTIDVPTGRIALGVSGSRAAQAPGTPSFSLLGSEAVRLHATNCTFTAIANNSKQKRCTFDLAIENRLQITDLVTPTSFPRPPQGATGVVVFPYSAASLGVPGGGAVPNSSWDNAPANFFNDFGGCVSGKTSDCYRWEGFGAPLYAGETSAARTVGFDVDKAAQSVSTYIVVAADLRDNPPETVTILPEGPLCGWVTNVDVPFDGGAAPVTATNPTILQISSYPTSMTSTGARRSFCSFGFSGKVPSGVTVLGGTLSLYVNHLDGEPERIAPLVVDQVDFGTALTDDDFDAGLITANIGTLPSDERDVWVTLAVDDAVKRDWNAGRGRSQFRMHFAKEGDDAPAYGSIYFRGPDNKDAPTLTIKYRRP
jgi:hypothetical protein